MCPVCRVNDVPVSTLRFYSTANSTWAAGLVALARDDAFHRQKARTHRTDKRQSWIFGCRLNNNELEGSADSDGASAVDRQFDSCDKPGRVAREIQRGVSDVFGCRHPSQRNAGDDPGAALRRIRAAKKLLDQTSRAHDRTYRVDSNVVGAELGLHRLRHYVDRGLGRVVPGEARTGPNAGRRSDVQDNARFSLTHQR